MKTVGCVCLVVLMLVSVSCATTEQGTQRKRSNLISTEEIQESGLIFNDAYDVVEYFRPSWLFKRGKAGPGFPDYVMVFLEFEELGNPENLRAIPAVNIKEIQHYTVAQAIRISPKGLPHGAIVVRERTQ